MTEKSILKIYVSHFQKSVYIFYTLHLTEKSIHNTIDLKNLCFWLSRILGPHQKICGFYNMESELSQNLVYTVHTKSFAWYNKSLQRLPVGGARGVSHTSKLGTFFLRSLTLRMPFYSNFQKNGASGETVFQKMQLFTTFIVVKSCTF